MIREALDDDNDIIKQEYQLIWFTQSLIQCLKWKYKMAKTSTIHFINVSQNYSGIIDWLRDLDYNDDLAYQLLSGSNRNIYFSVTTYFLVF